MTSPRGRFQSVLPRRGELRGDAVAGIPGAIASVRVREVTTVWSLQALTRAEQWLTEDNRPEEPT